jgi:DNA-binding transcriptional LysR family regulator
MLMELRQLEYVVAIAEEGTFTQAAVRVRVAQPAISQQVRRLERELGRRLFDRSGRPVRLTPAGVAFLPFARAALDAAADGRDAVASVEGTLTGRLRIGTVQAPPPFLSDLLGQFRADYPGVEITLRWEHAEELAGQVSSGALDAAVIGLGGQRIPPGVATRLLSSEPMVIAVGKDHPLAGRATTTLAALRDQPFVTLPAGSGLRTLVESVCVRAGFTPIIRAETDDLFLVAELVQHGLGIALLPRSVARRHADGLHLLRVQRPSLRRRLVLAWPRRQATAAGVAFRRFASRFASSASGDS